MPCERKGSILKRDKRIFAHPVVLFQDRAEVLGNIRQPKRLDDCERN